MSKSSFKLEHPLGSMVLSYVNMVCAMLRNSIPKSVVYCQVREAKHTLLDHFLTELGAKELTTLFLPALIKHTPFPLRKYLARAKQLGSLLDEDPAIMQRRQNLAKRLELYRNAQAEIDVVA
ncbi:hypothetical protein Droror1_Dr00026911 [Drosera rotundifolia]